MHSNEQEELKASNAVREFLRKASAKGGRSKSAKKLEAVRKNGIAPCKPGKHRGRPKKSLGGNGFQSIHE